MKYNYGIDIKATGKRIDSLLKKYGYTTTEVSEMFNITYQSVYKWRNGKGLPELQNLYILSQILGISMDDFIVECNTEKRKINGNECYLFFNKDICLDKRKNDYIIKMTSIIINHQDAKKINAKTTQRLKSYYSYPLNNAGSEVVF